MLAISPADPGLADELSRVAQAAKAHWGYPAAWMEAWRAALTLTPEFLRQHETFLARRDGAVCGFAALVPEGGRLWLEHLWVVPAAMGLGVGRTLFLEALRRAAARGFVTLEIESDPHAAGFYEHLGAVRVGTRPSAVASVPRELPLLRCATKAASRP